MLFRLLATLVLVAGWSRIASADCAPRCDYVLCSSVEADSGLASATVLSVTPGMYGDYPENPIDDGIEVEIVAMESPDGNPEWIGRVFTFQQAGWVQTEPGDEIILWLPNQIQDGSSLRPDVYSRDGDDVRCDGGHASIAAVVAATDEAACLAAFAGHEPASCDDTLGCSAASSSRAGWLPLLALSLLVCARRRRTVAHG